MRKVISLTALAGLALCVVSSGQFAQAGPVNGQAGC